MLIQSIFQNDSNVLLAGLILFLLVVLFVLLLHVYAKWFLVVHARRRRRNSVSVLSPPRVRRLNSYTFDTSLFGSPRKGLEPSVIASIPLFVCEPEEVEAGLDCVICLSVFEEGEIGRRLPKCGHGFHVDCIDMWLKSHSNCPICRAPVEGGLVSDEVACGGLSSVNPDHVSEVEVVVEAPSSGENQNRVGETGDMSSVISFSSSSSSLSSQVAALGDSFKRMLSRSRSEHKVHPSASAAQSMN